MRAFRTGPKWSTVDLAVWSVWVMVVCTLVAGWVSCAECYNYIKEHGLGAVVEEVRDGWGGSGGSGGRGGRGGRDE